MCALASRIQNHHHQIRILCQRYTFEGLKEFVYDKQNENTLA